MISDQTYVAAWPDATSRIMLQLAGVTKRVHLTTAFDKSGRLAEVPPVILNDAAIYRGRITALDEWVTRKGRHVVAVLEMCGWAHQINDYYRQQRIGGGLRYRPHLTLAKNVEPGAAGQFICLVGQYVRFDRHGFE